jgi:hypothetical protein
MDTPRIPQTFQTFIKRTATIAGLEGSWSQPYSLATLGNVTVFSVKEGEYQSGPRKGQSFLNLQLGWGAFYNKEKGKFVRRPIEVFERTPQGIEYILNLGIERGDRVNVRLTRPRVVNGGYEYPDRKGVTVDWATADLFTLNGVPNIEVIGHVDIAPAAVFTTELAEDEHVSAADEGQKPTPIDASAEFNREAAA